MRIMKNILLILLTLINSYLICGKFEKCSNQESNAVTFQLKESIDIGIKPCDDFHKYSCGNWYSRKSDDTLSEIEFKMKSELRNFLESDRQTLKGSKKRVIDIYKACINSNLLNTNETYSAYIEVLNKFSEWPILNVNWDPQRFDWIKSIAYLRIYGVQTLIRELIRPNPTNSSQSIIYLTQPKLVFVSRHNLLISKPMDSEILYLYERYIKYMMLDLGIKIRKAKIITQEILNFERQLAEIMIEESDLSIPKIQTLNELQSKFPKINFEGFFRDLFSEKIDPAVIYIAAQEDYFRKLETLIEQSSNDVLAKYLIFKFILHFNVKLGQHNWEQCLNDLESMVPELLLTILKAQPNYRNFDKSKNVVLSLFDNLKENFKSSLIKSEWLDPKTKEIALLKIDKMNANIADESNSDQTLYDGIKLETMNYHEIKLLISKLKAEREHFEFINQKNISHSKAKTEPFNNFKANAYYKLTSNSVQIPIGVMQPPFLLNHCANPGLFGSLGSMLGHELIHAFDYDGLNYDQHGNVDSWASPKSIIGFGKRAQCFIDQYENGYLTINENLADNAGLRLAFEVFEQFSLHGVISESEINNRQNFSSSQIFFISFAQLWCGNGRGGLLHSNHKDRVNNAVKNFDKFNEAFGCGVGSKMNPNTTKCQLW